MPTYPPGYAPPATPWKPPEKQVIDNPTSFSRGFEFGCGFWLAFLLVAVLPPLLFIWLFWSQLASR